MRRVRLEVVMGIWVAVHQACRPCRAQCHRVIAEGLQSPNQSTPAPCKPCAAAVALNFAAKALT